MKYQYTTEDYLNAIEREQQKRATTYPNIMAKMGKRGATNDEILEAFGKQGDQTFNLNQVKKLLLNDQATIDDLNEFPENAVFKHDFLQELIREYKMRLKCYPRFVYFKRITQAAADYELGLWKELTVFFADNYLGNSELALDALEPKKRRPHADPR